MACGFVKCLFPSRKTCIFSTRFFSSLEPAFILHPRVQTTNPQKQLLALTKSQIVPRPPKGFLECYQNLDVTPWKETIRKNIIYARNFDTPSEFTPHNYPFSLFQNIVKTLFSESPAEYLPILRDLHFVGNSEVAGTWSVKERLVGVRGSLNGTLVKSKRAWPVFYEDSLIEDSKSWNITSNTRDTFSNLNRWKVSLEKELQSPSYVSKYPHVHTVVLIDNEDLSEDQLVQRAVLYLHGYLSKQARNYIDKNESTQNDSLSLPQCAQAIVTNGKRYSFVWYQLNTLSLDDLSSGAKNLVAIEKPGLLYTTITRLRGGISHVFRRLDKYDENILKTFLTMFLWQKKNN